MALLGPQLVITLVMVSVIQKVGKHFSLARWMLCSTGLVRYLYPTDDELKTLAGIQKPGKGNRKGKHHHGVENGDTFHVPRNLDIALETCKVSPLDLVHLRYYSEFQWLLDFALYSSIVYILSEVTMAILKLRDEINLSMVWCLLVVAFSVKVLLSLTRQYFQSEESGERSTVIVTGFAYLLLAMVILVVDENNLELGLDSAYKSFNQSAATFLATQGIDSSGPASKIVLKFFLAVWCGLLGALFTFPGLRTARMHWDALRFYNESRFTRLVLNISFSLPFVLILLWVKPLSRDYLTIRVFQGLEHPLLTTGWFESVRLYLVVFTVVIRLILMPLYLQCYLNMAHFRLESIKKESGRIVNTELQKKIAAVFYYLCVVALQYITPLLICLFFTLMYKTLGGYTWTGGAVEAVEECPITPPTSTDNSDFLEESTITNSAQQFTLALESLKQVFNTEVYRGVLGLTTWWSCFAWFATSSMGIVGSESDEHEETKNVPDEICPRGSGKVQSEKRRCHSCLFCGAKVSKLSNHLRHNHLEEKDVQHIHNEPNKKKKRQLYQALQRKGDFQQYQKLCRVGQQGPVRVRRGLISGESDVKPCPYCLGFFSKKLMYRHYKFCTQKLMPGQSSKDFQDVSAGPQLSAQQRKVSKHKTAERRENQDTQVQRRRLGLRKRVEPDNVP